MRRTVRQPAQGIAIRAGAAAILLAASVIGAWAGERQMSSPSDAVPMSKAPAEPAPPKTAAPAPNRCEAGQGGAADAGDAGPGGEQSCGAAAAGEQMMLVPVTAMRALLSVMRMAADKAQEAVRGRAEGK